MLRGIDQRQVPKYLTTFHYYKKTVTDVIYHVTRGGSNNWYEEIFTLSEKPILSIREDAEPTSWQLKKINKYKSHSLRDDIIIKETHDWGFTRADESHVHDESQFKHPFEDTSSIDEFIKTVEKSCSVLGRNEICIFGHVEIALDIKKQKCLIDEMKNLRIDIDYNTIKDVCIDIKDIVVQKARGTGLSCDDKKCTPFTTTDTANVGVTLREPAPDVTFENPPILDTDRYDSKNIDGTYYTLDAPAILIKPDKIFRDIRNDTITFQIDRQNNPLYQIFAERCLNEHCTITAKSQNTTNTVIEGISGDKLEVFMPQTLDKLGIQDFVYDVRMFNLNREISHTVASTSLFIVDYTPKYSHDVFSYVMLESDGMTSFEKQWGTAMQYHGSIGTGKDDDGLLHQDRRSKINDSIHAVMAIDVSRYDGQGNPFEQNPVNATYHLNGGDDIVDIVQSTSPSILATLDKDSLGKYEKAMMSNGDTAVFTNAGFGRIKFVESESAIKNSTFANISIHSTIQSVDFGGYDETDLAAYSYEYPSAYLATILNITAINSDGTINETLPIDAEFRIREINGTKHLAQYMATFIKNFSNSEKEKTCDNPRCYQRYTSSPSSHIRNGSELENRYNEYADMYLGDMHDISNAVSGTGSVIHQINLPAVFIIPELWGVLDIKNSSDVSFSRYGEVYALGSPGIYDLVINSNGRENTVAFQTFDFSRGINYTINVDDGNYLNHTRYLSSAYVNSPDIFGKIKYLQVNDGEKITTCADQCYLDINENSTILAENIWGGTAQLYIVKQVLHGTGDQSEIVRAYIDNVGEVILLLATIVVIVVLYTKYWR